MQQQIVEAKGKSISKQRVLEILHDKLKEVDLKNEFLIDKIDAAVLKTVINEINKI